MLITQPLSELQFDTKSVCVGALLHNLILWIYSESNVFAESERPVSSQGARLHISEWQQSAATVT